MNFEQIEQKLSISGFDPLDPFEGLLDRCKRIGEGGYGEVYLYEEVNDRARKYAVKEFEIPRQRAMRDQILKTAENERKVLERLRKLDVHPNVVKTFLTFVTPTKSYFYSIMEFLPGGDLQSFISENGAQGEARILNYIGQLARGLHFLHSNKIVHYDMKSGNVLLDNCTAPVLLKICDYGLGKHFADTGAHSTTFTFKGTISFMAPEVAMIGIDVTDGFNRASDMWSLGAIGVHLATGKLPFCNQNSTQILRDLQKGRQPPEFTEFVRSGESRRISKLLAKLLIAERVDRYSADKTINLIEMGVPMFDSVLVESTLSDLPGDVDRAEIEALLLQHFEINGPEGFQNAVELLNNTADSIYWYGGECNVNDSISCEECIRICLDDRLFLFGWEYDVPTWEDEEPESIKLYLESVGAVSASASSIVDTIQSEYRGNWSSVVAFTNEGSFCAPHDVIFTLTEQRGAVWIMKTKNSSDGKQLHPEFNAAVIRKIVIDAVRSMADFNGVSASIKKGLENRYKDFWFVVIAHGGPDNFASMGRSYNMNCYIIGGITVNIRINWTEATAQFPAPPGRALTTLLKNSVKTGSTNPADMLSLLYYAVKEQFGGEWMSVGGGIFDVAGLIPGWEIPPVHYSYNVGSNKKHSEIYHLCRMA